MPLDGSFEEQHELICKCGKPAPFRFLAPLDKVTQQPDLSFGVRLALCRSFICDFQVRWEDREHNRDHAYPYNQTHPAGFGPMQHGEYENVRLSGNHSHIGSKLVIQNIHFGDLQAYSAIVPTLQQGRVDFETLTQYSYLWGIPEAFTAPNPTPQYSWS
ncbi:hypothetical protein F4677DRAFT_88702 [Hypoxylon crocopeplum]|nr:hypothetical protein F4677DRAFT_88702 [Hypoxylon crocopeplum]